MVLLFFQDVFMCCLCKEIKLIHLKLLAEVQAVKLNATQWMCDMQPGHGDIYISTMFLF